MIRRYPQSVGLAGLVALTLVASSCSGGGLFGGESSDGDSVASVASSSACKTLRKYAFVGIPATYIEDGSALLFALADEFGALGEFGVVSEISTIVDLTYQGPMGQYEAKSRLMALATASCPATSSPLSAEAIPDYSSDNNSSSSRTQPPPQTRPSAQPSSPDPSISIPVTCNGLFDSESLPIEFCQEGQIVAEVQQALVDRGFRIEVDGQYGTASATAVAQFQDMQGLPITGRVDSNTYSALLFGKSGAASPPTTLSPAQVLEAAKTSFPKFARSWAEFDSYQFIQACDEVYAVLVRNSFIEIFEQTGLSDWLLLTSNDFPGEVKSVEIRDVLFDQIPELIALWDSGFDDSTMLYGTVLGSTAGGCGWGKIPAFRSGSTNSSGIPNLTIDGSLIYGIETDGRRINFRYDRESRALKETSG